ncbi:periplasmic protein [Legionella santicrucis]|uniref:Periplasmic protein n=1 Tax=Legionella santicrucis TaxID=45074 RepID=A0A0W0Z3W6_9GAMM|nr:hypothetical protein [Legionella santicrucis]KTD63646.1 periplasmic protein [Legionella santicrucis]
MLARTFIVALSLILSNSLWGITCYFTLAKDNCWNKYTVSVNVIDAETTKVLTTLTVPAGKFWTRQAFPCQPGENLRYKATFSPLIWESEKGKVYAANHFWSLPNTISPGESAWNISVCYASDFSEVPLPPEASGTCKCDFDSIPPIPQKKI